MKKMLLVIIFAFIGVAILSVAFTFQASSRFRNFADDDDDDDDDDEFENSDYNLGNLALNLQIMNFARKILMNLSEELKLDNLNFNNLKVILS
jgi:hypothetical protein